MRSRTGAGAQVLKCKAQARSVNICWGNQTSELRAMMLQACQKRTLYICVCRDSNAEHGHSSMYVYVMYTCMTEDGGFASRLCIVRVNWKHMINDTWNCKCDVE